MKLEITYKDFHLSYEGELKQYFLNDIPKVVDRIVERVDKEHQNINSKTLNPSKLPDTPTNN